MKTIISGPVTQQHLADAHLMAGITPTSFLTNGRSPPPASNLPVTVDPICPKLPEAGERQRNMTMCLYADALICVGQNEHLVTRARANGLLVYEVPE